MRRNANTTRNGRSRGRQSSQGTGLGSTLASTLGMIGGAGVGAAMMYLFDPDQGSQRRHQIADMAGHAKDHVGEHVSHHAARLAGHIPQIHMPEMPEMPTTTDLRDRAAGWIESARGYLPSRAAHGQSRMNGACAATIAAAALVAGMGAMWLFDPARGRGRRAWLVQKGTRAVNETGRFASATGRHMRNKAKGYAHDAKGYAQDAVSHVQEAMPHHRLSEAQ